MLLSGCALIGSFAATPSHLFAQLEDSPAEVKAAESPFALKFGEARTVKYQIGAKIHTQNGAFSQVKIHLPVPAEWPEQTVSVIAEEIDDRAKEIEYRLLEGGVRQMMVLIPAIPANTQADVLITYEVEIRPILAPESTDELVTPKKKTRDISMALGESPLISTRDREVRKIVRELLPDDEPRDWERAKRLHTWVRENIQETVGIQQATEQTLETKQGCNEDRAALFVALTRAAKIPARLVMVEGSQHAEFCLEDPEGTVRWYPCSFVGAGEFGSLSRPAVVFQKGDHFRVPEIKKSVRLVAEYINGKGTVKPEVRILRQVVQ